MSEIARRLLFAALASAALGGCAHESTASRYSPRGYCYVQSGWQDSSSVCSPLSGDLSCYLQCPPSDRDLPRQP
jgi:hypothetical protein